MTDVCIVTDDSYAPFAAATLASTFDNLPRGSVVAYVVSSRLSEENRSGLAEVGATFGDSVVFKGVSDSLGARFAKGWTHSYITVETFYRFFLGEVLEASERVLYLDVDTIVLRDLSELCSMELGGSIAAVVQSYDEPHWGAVLNQKFGLPATHRYFNAGVLLLNLKAWREAAVGESLVRCAVERRTHDEVALNLVLSGRCTLVHPKFNVGPHLSFFADRLYVAGRYDFPATAYAEASRDPAIVHFCGGSKPWQYNSIHPQKRMFYKYLAMTPFAGAAPTDRTLRNLVLKPAYLANNLWWRTQVHRRLRTVTA